MNKKLKNLVALAIALSFGFGLLSQPATAHAATLSVSPTSLTLNYLGQPKPVKVTSDSSWTATSNTSWLKVSSAKGTKNSTLSISASKNPNATDRKGTITVKTSTLFGPSKKITVTQRGQATLSVSATSWTPSYATQSKKISVSSNTSWTVSSNSTSWLTVSPANGRLLGGFTIYVKTNLFLDKQRSGKITVKAGNVTKTIAVNQKPVFSLELSASVWSPSYSAQSKNFTIKSDASWTASSNSTSWLTVTPAKGTKNGTITIKVKENTSTTKSRSGKITVKVGTVVKTINVVQQKSIIYGSSNSNIVKDASKCDSWGKSANGVRVCAVEHGDYKKQPTGYNANFLVYKDKKLLAVFTKASTLPDNSKSTRGNEGKYPAVVKDGEYSLKHAGSNRGGSTPGPWYKVGMPNDVSAVRWNGSKWISKSSEYGMIELHSSGTKSSNSTWSTGCFNVHKDYINDFYNKVGNTKSGKIKVIRDITPKAS